MKTKIDSIELMVYLLGAYLFITSEHSVAWLDWFDWVWFAIFIFAYLSPTIVGRKRVGINDGENERLRVALEQIAHHRDHCVADAMLMSRIAREALERKGRDD